MRRLAVAATLVLLSVLSVGCGSPTSPAPTSPALSVSLTPVPIAVSVTTIRPVSAKIDGSWNVASYVMHYAETNGVPTHITGYQTELVTSDGKHLFTMSAPPMPDRSLFTVPPGGAGSISPATTYLGSSEIDPTGTMTLTMWYLDEKGNTQTASASAPVVR